MTYQSTLTDEQSTNSSINKSFQSNHNDVDEKTDESMSPLQSELDEILSTPLEKSTDLAQKSKIDGNKYYANQQYEGAIKYYTRAIVHSPDDDKANTAIYYNNRAAAYLMLNAYKTAMKDCNKAVDLDNRNPKILTRRATVYEKLDQLNEALEDYKQVLEIDPTNTVARQHITRLTPIVNERNEKMKAEMIDKLKGLGNSILGKFGMSLDNFKAEKDPKTGSYNIQFKQTGK